jgi:hypothetical protein
MRKLPYSSKPQSEALFSFNILPQWRFFRMAEASGFRAEGVL